MRETDAADAAWQAFLKQEGTSVLTSVFHGQSETRVACGACGWRTSSYDPFCCITLGRVGRTIAESLAHWCESEAVPDWRCDGCSIRGCGTRSVALARAPAVLMVLLPAFLFEQPAPERPAAITLDEVLRFSGRCSGRTYRLASVACHVGSRRERGHYHAICRADDGDWWQLDDDAPPQRVSSAAAPSRGRPYLAFYVSEKPA
jgi:ubiquitin C-terminal hydrolase